MPYRNIRFRVTNGQTATIGTGGAGYSIDEIKKITSLGIDYAVRQIASELVCSNSEYDPWDSFDYASLTSPEKLYLYLLELNPITPTDISTYTSIIGTSIKNGKAIINDIVTISQSGGLPDGYADNIHNTNVVPFLQQSPFMGGSAVVIDRLIAELDAAYENSCGSTNIIRTLKDLLLVLKEGKIYYIQYLAEKRRGEELSRALNKMAYKIKCLEQILAEITTNQMFMSGNISMKVNKPKPAIYALAIIDLYDAWYKFLYPNCPMDYTKLKAITDYVKTLGTEQEGRDELYDLLDVIYVDPFTDIVCDDVRLEDNPYYSWIPSEENWRGPGIKIPVDKDYKDTEYVFNSTTSCDESDLEVSIFDNELRYANAPTFSNALILKGSMCLKRTKFSSANFDPKSNVPCRTRKRHHTRSLLDVTTSSSDESEYKVSIFENELKYVEVGGLGNALVLSGSVCLKKNKIEGGNKKEEIQACKKSRRRRIRYKSTFKPYCC